MKIKHLDNHEFRNCCSICGQQKESYTAVLSDTDNYLICQTCYPKYDCLDNNGKKWLEGEYMKGMRNTSFIHNGVSV